MEFLEAVQKIAAALNPQQIILFGSRARGDHKPDSDYDLLVVVDDEDDDEVMLTGLAYKTVRGQNLKLDVIVYAESEFNFSAKEQHDIVCYALDDGKVMYARGDTALA
jgi:uncharacterized protein